MKTVNLQDDKTDDGPMGALTLLLNRVGVDYEIMPRSVTGLGCPIAKASDIQPNRLAQLTVLKVNKTLVQVLHGFDSLLDMQKLKAVVSPDLELANADDLAQAAFAQGMTHSLALPVDDHAFYLDGRLADSPHLHIRVHENSCLIRIQRSDLKKLIPGFHIEDIATPIKPFDDDWLRADDEHEVRTAVEKFTQRRIKARLDETLQLPPIPQIANDLMLLRANENADSDDLVGLIENDPGLAAQIVSWASSPYYGAGGGVASVKDAVVRILGYDVVMNLALGLALTQPFNMPKEGPFGVYPFWEETIALAHLMEAVAKLMAKAGVPISTGFAYLAGLLANFGTFILAQVFPPFFEEISRCLELNPHLPEFYVDRFKLGVSRECIAAQLFRSWRLPEEVVIAVRWQHHPDYDGEGNRLAKLLYLCHQLVRSQGLVYKHVQPVVESMISDLGLALSDLDDLIEQLPQPLNALNDLVNSIR